MRNVQRTARLGGAREAELFPTARLAARGAAIAGATNSNKTGAIITTACRAATVAVADVDGSRCGMTQFFIAAQQPIHFISCETCVCRAHACAGIRTIAPRNTRTSKIAIRFITTKASVAVSGPGATPVKQGRDMRDRREGNETHTFAGHRTNLLRCTCEAPALPPLRSLRSQFSRAATRRSPPLPLLNHHRPCAKPVSI